MSQKELKNVISTNITDWGELQIYYGNSLLATIEDGDDSEEFVEEVLNGMGYEWHEDGSISKIK